MSLCSKLIKIFTGTLMIVVILVLSFFIYEEWADINRYSDIGIILVKDDYYQSSGIRRPETNMKSLVKEIGYEKAVTFAHMDRDGNGLLSAEEIEPLVHLIKQNKTHQVNARPPSCSDQDCLKVSVAVGKVDLQNTTFLDLTTSDSGSVSPIPCSDLKSNFCRGELKKFLVQVKPVSDAARVLSHRHFLAFLPRSKDLTVGQPFYIVDYLPESDYFFIDSFDTLRKKVLSYVELHERALSVILEHFYGGSVCLYPSSEPRFSMGIVRAKTSEYVAVEARLMVEFSGFRDFIIAPSAIVGSVVIRLSDFKVMDFELHQESDIVRIFPLMDKAIINGIAGLQRLEMKAISRGLDVSTISWTEAISRHEAQMKLIEKMNGGKPLKFRPFSDLRAHVRGTPISTEERPIFLIVSSGNLYDQTCHSDCQTVVFGMKDKKVALKLIYEFTLVKAIHWDTMALQRQKNLTVEEKDLMQLIRKDIIEPINILVLSHDGKKILHKILGSEFSATVDSITGTDNVSVDEDEAPTESPGHVKERERNRRFYENAPTILLALLNKALREATSI